MSTAFSSFVINKALADRPWIQKRGAFLYRIVPRSEGHGKYEARGVLNSKGEFTAISCVEYRTSEPCRGYKNTGNCYHLAALALHLSRRWLREQKRMEAA